MFNQRMTREQRERVREWVRQENIITAKRVSSLCGFISSILMVMPIVIVRIVVIENLGYLPLSDFLVMPVLYFLSAIVTTFLVQKVVQRFILEDVDKDNLSLIQFLNILTFASALATGALVILLVVLLSVMVPLP